MPFKLLRLPQRQVVRTRSTCAANSQPTAQATAHRILYQVEPSTPTLYIQLDTLHPDVRRLIVQLQLSLSAKHKVPRSSHSHCTLRSTLRSPHSSPRSSALHPHPTRTLRTTRTSPTHQGFTPYPIEQRSLWSPSLAGILDIPGRRSTSP